MSEQKSPLIDSVTANGFCTGCGLCAAVAPPGHIRMTLSKSGFLRPIVLKSLPASTERQISYTCPGIVVGHPAGVQNYHPIWGPLLSVQTGHATNPEIRKLGSSGGVLSALALHLLESGKVDFVAQIAVSKTDPLANALQLSRTREDVISIAGTAGVACNRAAIRVCRKTM
jgi:coenzyme F420 hydrogenase subunit beta